MVMKFQFVQFFLTLVCAVAMRRHNCDCVPYDQCDEDGGLLVEGNGVLDPRLVRTPQTHCKEDTVLCCTSERIPNGFGLSKGCGHTTHNDYPWLGTLYYQRNIGQKPAIRCGVSFIHKQVAITAAHCFNREGTWSIKGGDDDIHYTIDSYILHPKFKRADLHNDIAIVILEETISDLTNENLICIPPPGINPRATSCLVGSFVDELRSDEETVVQLIDLPLVDKEKCLESLRKTILGEFFQLHRSFLCAGGEKNIDTGKGDGGIPLVCPIAGQRGRYHQIGIVSWGVGGGQYNTPGVYVNVAIYRDWIDRVMIEHNFDVSSYRY